ncbi:amine oxidase [Methylobacterium sp. 4-46]|uniref:flavin monoamine oxidase family protein n=1 Tax=unclassified Methylobacterium TaxID=2615210 RepID=UPI000165C6FC|nr:MULTISPECIES: FAD-dependent oxidoreductase [Methylobacterium]ACA17447.1 amine oxidase [Methylobacterium sp. 4-46]WFT83132.1 FAD-dependent oxidoreductase [Methylobacterium nodulans]
MPLSRRSLLAGAAALALPRRARAAEDAEVAVIGAGAAGLAAAAAVTRAGHSVAVLEARARIGGRAFTDGSLGPDRAFDAGGQYIHWAERNPWKAVALADGVRLTTDEAGPWPSLIIDGAPATDETRRRRRAGFVQLTALLDRDHPGEDRSIGEAARAVDPALGQAAAGLTRLSLGEEPDRVSLHDYDQLWAGEDLWVDGYGALVARHHAGLPVRTGCPVRRVDWSGPGVALDTPAGRLRAAVAIVTVPVGVLAAGALRFTPELPADLAAAIDGLRMGAYTKVALALDPARAGDPRDAVILRSARGDAPDLTAYLEMRPFGRPLAVLHLGGDAARLLCEAGEAAAVAAATDAFASVFGATARASVTAGRLAAWWTDPFARGSYSLARPGRAGARAALRRPVGERLFFAGEAASGGGAMTVGGATLDGERAAAAALAALGH